MPSADQFPEPPPVRFELTEEQAAALRDDARASVFVIGYARRHPWPDHGTFTLCAWFADQENTCAALEAAGIMTKAKGRKRRKRRKRRKKRKQRRK